MNNPNDNLAKKNPAPKKRKTSLAKSIPALAVFLSAGQKKTGMMAILKRRKKLTRQNILIDRALCKVFARGRPSGIGVANG
jgi:hypothetical protein